VKVVDSSSVAKFVNREENWEAVEKSLRGSCVSLEFAVKETGNSLWKRVHRGLLDRARAQNAFQEFVESRPFAVAEQQGLYARAFKIAASSDVPMYDALFLALSEEREAPLVTSDPSQAEAAKKLGLQVEFIP